MKVGNVISHQILSGHRVTFRSQQYKALSGGFSFKTLASKMSSCCVEIFIAFTLSHFNTVEVAKTEIRGIIDIYEGEN